MDYNSDEIAVRKAIAGCGKQNVLVVDGTKMGADLACQMGHIRDFDVVVTGARLAPALLRDCRQAVCRVIEV